MDHRIMGNLLYLNEKQNIMLRKGDECIYAKVIRKEEGDVVICFTSMTQNVST